VNRFSCHAGLVDVAMTVHTPSHRERFELPNTVHRFDWAVTALARDLGRNMRPVIEVHKLR
jgi:hypothetical protein